MKPDESFSDDFLFPMTSTRLSYTSSPESDGEFCDPETPRTLSRNQSYDPNSQMQQNTQFNGIQQTQKVTRSNSNPSLHREDGTIKSDNGAIPDYNSPPPYAVNLPATVSYALYQIITIRNFLRRIFYSTYDTNFAICIFFRTKTKFQCLVHQIQRNEIHNTTMWIVNMVSLEARAIVNQVYLPITTMALLYRADRITWLPTSPWMSYPCLLIPTLRQFHHNNNHKQAPYPHPQLELQTLHQDIPFCLNKIKTLIVVKDPNLSHRKTIRVVNPNYQKCHRKLIDKRNQAGDPLLKDYLVMVRLVEIT